MKDSRPYRAKVTPDDAKFRLSAEKRPLVNEPHGNCDETKTAAPLSETQVRRNDLTSSSVSIFLET